MVNKCKLKAAIAAAGLTQGELCEKIGMATNTFIRKRDNGTFTCGDLHRIEAALNLDAQAIHDIFLS